MTLYTLINKLKDISLTIPNINSAFDGDIFLLNSKPNIDYGVFFITQSQHTVNENTKTFNLTLYFVDRVFEDDSNVLSVQSMGIEVLSNIINIFNYENDDVNIEYGINFNTFIHKFTDKCSGVYANIAIEVENNVNLCGE